MQVTTRVASCGRVVGVYFAIVTVSVSFTACDSGNGDDDDTTVSCDDMCRHMGSICGGTPPGCLEDCGDFPNATRRCILNASSCDDTASCFGECSCDESYDCDPGCDCDPECSGCDCDTTSGCEDGCSCDPDCGGCDCDTTSGCEDGCSCDPDCGGCDCDTSSSCQDGCSCDPDCTSCVDPGDDCSSGACCQESGLPLMTCYEGPYDNYPNCCMPEGSDCGESSWSTPVCCSNAPYCVDSGSGFVCATE
jgi:hypothetical protein